MSWNTHREHRLLYFRAQAGRLESGLAADEGGRGDLNRLLDEINRGIAEKKRRRAQLNSRERDEERRKRQANIANTKRQLDDARKKEEQALRKEEEDKKKKEAEEEDKKKIEGLKKVLLIDEKLKNITGVAEEAVQQEVVDALKALLEMGYAKSLGNYEKGEIKKWFQKPENRKKIYDALSVEKKAELYQYWLSETKQYLGGKSDTWSDILKKLLELGERNSGQAELESGEVGAFKFFAWLKGWAVTDDDIAAINEAYKHLNEQEKKATK